MPDQELLDDFLEALEQAGSSVKNPALRQALGWDEARYNAVKAELVKRKIVVRGKGRSDTVSLVGAEPAAVPAPASSSGRKATDHGTTKDKSLESWIWDAACSIRGAKDAAKYKDYILPLIFTKRLCDVFDDELNRIAEQVGSRAKAFQLVQLDHKLVRFYLPLKPEDPEQPVWSVIRQLADRIGEGVTNQLRAIARENPRLQGIIDRVDFNATTHGQRDLDDDRLSNLIEAISNKRLGLKDVEADIIGKSYEYLIRKFAEGSGQSAGEFYTPPEAGEIISKVLQPEPGMEIYDPCCGSGGLLVKCEVAMEGKAGQGVAPLKLYGQEYVPETWAMANMNMIIHDLEGEIEIGDTFKNPKFRLGGGRLRTFDRVVANPMWNQDWFTDSDYDSDELGRFPAGAGFPGKQSADWGWIQHIAASLNECGRGAVVLDTGAASRGSGNAGTNKEKSVRQWFVEQDLIESVLYLPENLFYNTTAPGIVVFLNKAKPAERQGRLLPGCPTHLSREIHVTASSGV
jgi:type I restriction enzyme M protein